MRKLSVLVALITGAGALAMFAPAAGAATTGSVSCQNFSGQIQVDGKPLTNKHPGGPREAMIDLRKVSCTTTGVTGTRHDWSIDTADLKIKFPLAGSTCDGLTALKLGPGEVVELAKFKHNREILGHQFQSTAATVEGNVLATPGSSVLDGNGLAVTVRTIDFRGETATLTITPGSLVSHCAPHQKNTIDFTASFTVG
jgi:hypothetical protein